MGVDIGAFSVGTVIRVAGITAPRRDRQSVIVRKIGVDERYSHILEHYGEAATGMRRHPVQYQI
jgi:hypothetical protein